MANVILIISMLAVLLHENQCHVERLWQADKFSCNFSNFGFGSRATRADYAKCLWTKAGILREDGTFDMTEIPEYIRREFGHLEDYMKILDGFKSCAERVFKGMEAEALLQCIKDEHIWDMMNA